MSNNKNNDYFINYEGFNDISKSDNHIISIKSSSKIGVCDLNSNCSSIEVNITKPENYMINDEEVNDYTLNVNQLNKLSLNIDFYTIDGSSVNLINPINPIKTITIKESFTNIIIDHQLILFILIVILLIYCYKKKYYLSNN